jgi:NAD(P)-dependent dehydrogenase (short-subunit alcohol dehydrogenase family)
VPDERRVHPGGSRDGAQRGALVAALAEQLRGGVEDGVAGAAVPGAPATRPLAGVNSGRHEWNKIFEINVTGTLRGIQTCAPLIKDSGGGSIVNIGSVAGITGNFGTGYSSSKWALEGLSRSAAYVFADWRIRCNVIQPGWIETDLTASMSSNPLMKRMTKHTMNNTVLLRRSGKAEEIANTALFLASDESSYITGTDIVVDGGWFSSAPTSATSGRTTC